jgi:hypothetical protein
MLKVDLNSWDTFQPDNLDAKPKPVCRRRLVTIAGEASVTTREKASRRYASCLDSIPLALSLSNGSTCPQASSSKAGVCLGNRPLTIRRVVTTGQATSCCTDMGLPNLRPLQVRKHCFTETQQREDCKHRRPVLQIEIQSVSSSPHHTSTMERRISNQASKEGMSSRGVVWGTYRSVREREISGCKAKCAGNALRRNYPPESSIPGHDIAGRTRRLVQFAL